MTRLVGLQNALAYILHGKSMKPGQAKALGLVDKLVDVGHEPADGSNTYGLPC